MKTQVVPQSVEKPSVTISVVICGVAVALMAYLRLYLFGDRFISLTYGLPLLLCLWHRDRRLLWAMAGAFTVLASIKAFWLLPDPNPRDWAEPIEWAMQVTNIVVIGGVVHAVLNLTGRLLAKRAKLEAANAELAARQEEIGLQNEKLRAQAEELAQQNEEQRQQSEELNRQNEELQQSSEELEQQSEELQTQAEELQAANQELNEREAMLQTILGSLRGASDEPQMLTQICQAVVQLAGNSAASAAVVERVGEQLVVRASAGVGKLRQEQWPFTSSFASLVMAQGRTAFVEDLAARPDLVVPEPEERKFRSLLATPLQVHGQAMGALEVYSSEPRPWTKQEFRILEWAAAQCSLALETLRLQQELQTHRQLLETVVNNIPAAVNLMRGSDLRLQWVNPAYQAIAPGKEMVGKTLDELWPEIGREFSALCQRVLETGESYHVEDELNRIQRHPGAPPEPAYFSWSLHRVPLPENQGWGLLNTAWETTARKQAEQGLRESERQFRALADSIPNLAWWANADGYITWYNRRWYEYTGTTPAQMEGWGWQTVHDPQMLPEVLERWKASIATGEPFDMEFPLRGADGSFRWFLTRVIPLRDESGQVMRWFGTNTDVSEAREVREVLARSKAELEQIVAERTAQLKELVGELEHFSYSITHDMRAPLRAMRGFAEMVSESCSACSQEEQKAYLRRIMVSADRMDALIRDALNYSQAVRQELPLEAVDTATLLRGMLDSYPELQQANAVIELDRELPVVVGNKAGLTQCFSNLLGNAIKFVQPGQRPEIRVWAEPVHHQPNSQLPTLDDHQPSTLNHQRMRIWVEDKGIGISKAMLPRVFDMFSRGQKNYEGTGIGLALVRKVVHRMGGTVGVQSEEGKGSRFWLELKRGESLTPASGDGKIQ